MVLVERVEEGKTFRRVGMEKPSRDARRTSPDPVLVVDVHRHAGIPRAMLKIEIAPASVQPISACHSTHRERERERRKRGSGG